MEVGSPIEENATVCICHKICGAENQYISSLSLGLMPNYENLENPFRGMKQFDPLRRGLGAAYFAIPARIVELYDRGEQGME